MRIDETVQIAAPAPVVWRVITDLSRYPEWNPFVRECRSDLAVGSPIDMKVHLFAGATIWQRERILTREDGIRICYGLEDAFFGALSSTRCHVVSQIETDVTCYASRFELRGPLAPVVGTLLGAALRRGFSSMTAALARRAEQMKG